ncbi:hypothetical protein GmHk_16G046878 [Glycine max]|nr:hypothetical protein GmHk_16G046878 [Glycine max]
MQVGGCSICGGAHDSSSCMTQDDASKEVNYMANQNRQGFHLGVYAGYQQGGNFSHNKGQGWRSHPRNQFNKDQGGPSNRPPNQGPDLYERTTKLEDTLTQFMQVSLSNHKSTESVIKNLEIQVGQLAKQLAENSSGNLGANTEKNPKEECEVMITRSQRRVLVEKESKNNEGELAEEEK